MTDTRVDQYIAGANDFAKPILTHLREVVHEGCPDVEEAMKWSRPAFLHRGKILGMMSAFKEHCSFGFWAPEVNRKLEASGVAVASASGSLGRLTSLKDLPARKELVGYVREAAELLNQPALGRRGERITRMTRGAAKRPELAMPAEFETALKKDQAAVKAFRAFPPSQQYEYVEWIVEAKREETRQKRIATALEWLAEGKPRHWKYMK